ncbi:MAG TPA: GNAT family N-acetyltransferase [Rubrivivax sp.]
MAGPEAVRPTVTLREVTRHNIHALMKMDAGDGGKQVAGNAKSMAQAAVYAEAWPRAIYAGDEPVGFVMLSDPKLVTEPEEPEYFLWRLMIDKNHHRRGYGHAAVQLLIEHVKTRPHDGELLTSIVEPAPQLLAFYGGLGFVRTERVLDGEQVLRLAL